MKRTLLVACLLFAGSAVSAQSSLPKGLTVNGVPLDAKYAEVTWKLGHPTRVVTTSKIDECIGARIRTVTYPGLKIEMVEGEKKDDFTIFSFEITSGKWDVSGVRVGDPSAKVQKLFGARGRRIENKPTLGWFYDMTEDNPGSSNFFFRAGKIYKISTTYEMC
jgi:hypothetical protein